MKCFSFCIKCLLWKLKRCLRLASKETRGKRSQSPAFPSLLYHRAQNLAVSSHNDLQWKRCCFSHCGQGEGYCFSGGQACVYRTKEVHHPASLSPALFFLCLSLYLSSVCGPQGSLQLEQLVGLEWMRGWSVWRRLLWSEVHHWPIPPPASTLAARCSPGKGPYPLLPIPSCLWRNAPGPRTLKMRPLFLFCLFFFNFLIHSFEHSRRFLCVLVSLYGSWLSTIFVDDATWPPCQSSHLIIWAWTFRRENHPKTKTLNRQWFWISCRRGFTLSKFAQQLPVHAHVFCWQNIVTLAVEAPVANNERPRRNAGLQISLELRSPPFMDFKECLNGLESWERSAMTDERLLRYLPRERLAEWVTIPVRPSTFLKFQRDFSRL